MAQKVNVLLVDDIDGSEAIDTITFGVDGTGYEIDLNAVHAGELREGLSQFIEHARKATSRSRAARVTQNTEHRADTTEVRAWLIANGYGDGPDGLKDRGRIPEALREKYERRIPKAVVVGEAPASLEQGFTPPAPPAAPETLVDRMTTVIEEAESVGRSAKATAAKPAAAIRQRRTTTAKTADSTAKQPRQRKPATAKTTSTTTGKKTGE